MEEFIQFISYFLLGFLSCLILNKGIIKVTVHRINEDIVPDTSKLDIRKLEDEMLDEHQDPQDDMYQTKAIMNDVMDVMGGSDRL